LVATAIDFHVMVLSFVVFGLSVGNFHVGSEPAPDVPEIVTACTVLLLVPIISDPPYGSEVLGG
jgi:hypothetical protein